MTFLAWLIVALWVILLVECVRELREKRWWAAAVTLFFLVLVSVWFSPTFALLWRTVRGWF